MANPYPALITDANSETRVAGQINFTDPANQPGGGSSAVQSVTGTMTLADMEQWFSGNSFQLLADPGPGTTIAVPFMGFMNFKVGAHAPAVAQQMNIAVVGDLPGAGDNLLAFTSATVGLLDQDIDSWKPIPAARMVHTGNAGGGLFVFGFSDLDGFTVAGSNPTLTMTLLYVVLDAPAV